MWYTQLLHFVARISKGVAMIIISLFILANATSGKCEETSVMKLHLTSCGGNSLFFWKGNNYYLENCQTLFGRYTVLYRVNSDIKALERVTVFWGNYISFAGTYNDKIILQFDETNYTNYPLYLRYALFDPSAKLKTAMPECIEKMIECNSRVILQGYGDYLIINLDGFIYYCDFLFEKLILVDDRPFNDVRLMPSFCCAERNGELYVMDYKDGKIQILNVNSGFFIMPVIYEYLHVPETCVFYHLSGS